MADDREASSPTFMANGGEMGQCHEVTEPLVFDDGEVHHIFDGTSPYYDELGEVRGAVGMFVDITGHQQALVQQWDAALASALAPDERAQIGFDFEGWSTNGWRSRASVRAS